MKKNSFTLIELITSITILSIVIIFSMLFFKQNLQQSKDKTKLEIEKLDFLATKVFIQNKLKQSSKVLVKNNQLVLDSNTIYYHQNKLLVNKAILLQDIKSFTVKKKKYVIMNICTNKICQEFILKYEK